MGPFLPAPRLPEQPRRGPSPPAPRFGAGGNLVPAGEVAILAEKGQQCLVLFREIPAAAHHGPVAQQQGFVPRLELFRRHAPPKVEELGPLLPGEVVPPHQVQGPVRGRADAHRKPHHRLVPCPAAQPCHLGLSGEEAASEAASEDHPICRCHVRQAAGRQGDGFHPQGLADPLGVPLGEARLGRVQKKPAFHRLPLPSPRALSPGRGGR